MIPDDHEPDDTSQRHAGNAYACALATPAAIFIAFSAGVISPESASRQVFYFWIAVFLVAAAIHVVGIKLGRRYFWPTILNAMLGLFMLLLAGFLLSLAGVDTSGRL